MGVVSDEVFYGLRCAVCENCFGVGDDVVMVTATGERMHRECPREESRMTERCMAVCRECSDDDGGRTAGGFRTHELDGTSSFVAAQPFSERAERDRWADAHAETGHTILRVDGWPSMDTLRATLATTS